MISKLYEELFHGFYKFRAKAQVLPLQSLHTFLEHSCKPLCKPNLCLRLSSLTKSMSISPAHITPYEVSNSEAKYWSSDLNQFFERLYTVRRIHGVLKDMAWNSDSQEKLKNLNVAFDIEIVSQVLRSGGIPPTTCMGLFYWLKDEQDFFHTFHTYDAIIGMLRESGRIDDMSAVIEDYRSSTPGQDSIYFHNLIRWYAKANNVDGALVVWDQMRGQKHRPGVGLCNIMIDLLGHWRRYHELILIYHQTVHTGYAFSACTYTILIKHLASAGKLDAGVELFRKLPFLKVRQTALMFAILISQSASVHDQEQVRHLRMQITEVSVKPTRQVLAFMQAMVKSGKSMESEIVGQCFWPELTIEERTRMCASVGSFYGDEDENGTEVCDGKHEHNEAIYCVNDIWSNKDNDCCVNISALAHALRRWKADTESCLGSAQVRWTSQLVYRVLCRIRKADAAWKFFNWVQVLPGFTHTAPVISRMIVILAVNRDMPAVELLLSKAKEEGIPLSVHIVSAAIKAYGMMRNSDKAMETFHRLKDFGLEPNVEAYANVIHALVKQGRCLKAKEYFNHMHQSGLRPTSKVNVMLIECFGLAGELDTARSLFGQLANLYMKPDADVHMKPDVDMYTAMIKVYFWNQKPDMALKAFEDCEGAGLQPTADCIDTMTKGLCLLNRREEAKALQRKYAKEVSKEKVLHCFEVLMQIYDILEKNLVGKDLISHPTTSG